MITLRTTQGDIAIELDFANAPTSAANYLQYARDGFYNGTIFHRVIPGFMVQGGGMDANMQEKASRDSIENEADNGLANDIGTLAITTAAKTARVGAMRYLVRLSMVWMWSMQSLKCLQAALVTTRTFRLRLSKSPKLLSAMPTLTNK